MLHFVTCYSGGDFNKVPDICQTMAVEHGTAKPQEGESPYKIVPDNITVVPEHLGKPTKGECIFFLSFTANE